ncbi:MAG: bifunctional diguanylate cyclase/phosphodiesterase [Gammaproteobacteria bacterium]|nr:bifunctional diguanylate cyclase/phosphodiesterase [Gammaproteobacteria bacterium]
MNNNKKSNSGDDHQFSSLDTDEKRDIEKKVDFEIANSHYRMLKLGAVANLVGGALFVLTSYGHRNSLLIFSWYTVLVLTNGLNILWESSFKNKLLLWKQLKTWRSGFLIIFAGICLVWGSIGIIFVTPEANNQFSIIIFLLAVLVCFSLSSVTDFTLATVSIVCLLLPSIFYNLYSGIYNASHLEAGDALNIRMSSSLFVCGIFLLVACYIGEKIVRQFFRLSFENVELTKKLENSNIFLEKRVKDRTIQLEKSLKLVTYQSTHDLLTNLPNNRLLLEFIPPAIKSAKKNNTMFAILNIFINEMEKINDGLGHQAGEMAIQEVAKRLQKAFSTESKSGQVHYNITLSRKDDFVILISHLSSLEEAELKAEEFFKILAEPLLIEKHAIKLTASMGVSLYPHDGKSTKALLMNADIAMLNAKLKGGNSLVLYKPENQIDLSMQLQIESKLHEALEKSEFILQYQPLVRLSTGEMDGLEALVRWQNKLLGLITPGYFIPLAEANGVIVPLGEWVFRTACMQAKRWHDMGYSKLTIAINFSAKQLQDKNIVESISAILNEVKIDPGFVELELTESEAFHHDIIPILKKFKDKGMRLSIDDFGTGYSGLTSLKLLEIDKIKIDKSFIDDVVTNIECSAIVTNTINLAKKMKITVLAEGVETVDQLNFLRDNGCDLIQGFYFSKPIDPEEITELLKNKIKFNV